MTKEQLKKAEQLIKKIDIAKENIKWADYTQAENVLIRESRLSFNGIKGEITIPESLFRVVGKLILSEYNQELIELEKQFTEL